MLEIKRSLYMCSNVRVKDFEIKCPFGNIRILLGRLQQGYPLELTVCQACAKYDPMGDPVLKEDRGWQPVIHEKSLLYKGKRIFKY